MPGAARGLPSDWPWRIGTCGIWRTIPPLLAATRSMKTPRCAISPAASAFFTALLAELEKAEHFIFLEFFIIQEGYMWGRVLEILERKVRAGVEVRVLYDGTCAIYKLPYSYPKRLRELGIQCKMFMPLRPLVSTHYNNRDHRKIVVVDGKAAFTGGVNLADEYINRRHPFGHWKDAAVLLQGEAVRSFTLMFLQLWHVDEKWENYERYLSHGCAVRAQGYVIPFADSPLDGERWWEMVYLDILSRARRYVHIMTPYLILDGDLITASGCFLLRPSGGWMWRCSCPRFRTRSLPMPWPRPTIPSFSGLACGSMSTAPASFTPRLWSATTAGLW